MVSTANGVRIARVGEESSVVSTIVSAFTSDPASRWAYPEPDWYFGHFPAFVRALGGKAFAHGSAWLDASGGAAALWLPPGVLPDDDVLGEVLRTTAPAAVRDDLMLIFDRMGAHHPDGPQWYLPLIGVDPPLQGQGLGSALLRHALAECDRDRTPAYLESSNARNIPLYQRHGFELVGRIQAGSSPPIFPMLRRPVTDA